ncbi:UNVERIFIED_CONTAM: hypothetical protein RMT77_007709 [Armadillidium vulgare]
MRWCKKLKVLRCYLFILGWLGILLICLSYWKIDADNSHAPGPLPQRGHKLTNNGISLSENKPRHKKTRIHCNSPERIRLGHEGEIPTSYKLLGVLIAIRHGDRGPLHEVRNFSSINCGYKSTESPQYKNYVSNLLNVSKTHSYINFVGPFMKYPILPAPFRCSIGHLTPLGVVQHLQLGKVLRALYIDKIGLISDPWEIDDVIIYSTKFRRTFQSILAFLHSFLPIFNLSNLRIRDTKGIYFCGDYCRCDKALVYEKKHEIEKQEYLKSHPSVAKLVAELNPLVKAHDYDEDITNPFTMRDALLAYACHGAKLPCVDGKCISFEDLSKLLSYEEMEARQKRTPNQIKSSKLNSYGFLKNIMMSINGIKREEKPKVIIYSGHDKSLNNLLTSLGITHFQAPYYASRVIFEIYHNSSVATDEPDYKKNYHFRLIYNGKDITKQLTFCNVKMIKRLVSKNSKGSDMNLCPVESLEQYLKPAFYFKDFNISSFTSACLK